MVSKNYVFLLGTCQKVHVTVSERLNIVNCLTVFFLGRKSTKINLKEIGYEGVEWILLARDTRHYQVFRTR
jgi:hypothetical protein